ncbi:S-layer family protein [Laspinema olomoucense]|uniref:S-layer family protein n=1 Tax=Laspinema olomoucense TaxID=3231600 RepID=UPI0021BAAD92|nr:S-layer family protein [Laspinema sp. D3c]MCT7996552.1 S-layer family protein [Laspinema sp. D3c]
MYLIVLRCPANLRLNPCSCSQDFRGGHVSINTQGIFGTEFRDRLSDQTSDITPTLERDAELSGIVTLNTPELDPTDALVPLDPNFLDPSAQITTGCQGDKNSFTVVGRRGIPASPTDLLSETRILTDLGRIQGNRITVGRNKDESKLAFPGLAYGTILTR